ncbi:histidine kinase 2/3/4 (cytokinin receptor) protein [Dioscorea alata]|uniref:Histidine kinase 2/3/4 (Cytokinin receptor) protein n=2 Tax=Dioscorea alata TaxID=55571 RepID=A0ACB7VYX8_DIOAL|nr:histidine kinase 2/3/4 (cytokinin receptor) protein [Dioscorea alata]KAH7679838.1 histidine kinase 2/3/4 (cytokinin receptor) protein [Dioscorea alata]
MGYEMGGERRRWWLNRSAMVVLWVVVSLGIWACLHLYIRRVSMRKAEEALVSMCEERARMIQDQFAVSVNHVHALAILISTFHYQKHPSAIDQETFAHYTARTAFERPLLNGVAYAQRVAHMERERFENEQGWIIKTMKHEPSPMQDEYAPVIFSQETVSYIEALDMMSGEEDRENIIRARATGKAVLTNPFRLLGSNHLGVVLTFPVYRSGLPADATVDERVENTAGYLGGAFDVESLVENLLRQLAGSQDIMVNVYDVTNISEPLIMYGPQQPDGYMSLSHVSMLDFGDPFRKHHMECRYSQKPPIPLSAITTPSGVFVICMLAGYILYAAWNRYDNVKEDCRKMEELKVQAEAADVAKSQFLATVSHEIRTPMNGVLGMLDMLLDTDLNLTQRDFAQTAQVCGKALISLINEVLDRAKIEAGKLEIEAVPFDLRSILDEVLSLFSAASREKGIELATFVSDRVPEVLTGDPGRFRQIITNLVGNSVKFTEGGHIFVQVHLVEHSNMVMDVKSEAHINGHSDEQDHKSNKTLFNTLSGLEAADNRNSWENFKHLLSNDASQNGMPGDSDSGGVTLIVSVEDTGIGIPLQAQDRVFTPFMQADSSTSRNYGGTGIGLSISKCLVELMGGQINFISRPQVGSTFTFTVVLQRCNGSAIDDAKRAIPEPLPASFRGMKSLIIDERPVRGAVTAYHLRRLGIAAEVVCNVKTAINMLAGQNGYSKSYGKQPNLIFVEKDSWSSGTDAGLRKQLMQHKQNGHSVELPKVILLVTSEYDKTKTSFEDGVIMKPLRASTVGTCLLQVLGAGGVQQRKQTPNGSTFLHNLLVGKNILVVDDNKVNLRVAAGALKKYGANVACAESGKDALSLLQLPHKFDACFMDVQMPEMDGFEATRQIRLMESKVNKEARNTGREGSEKSEWHLPVLAMTADVIQATYEECLKCGMDGYVSKPFDEQQLYQAVAKFLLSKPEQ